MRATPTRPSRSCAPATSTATLVEPAGERLTDADLAGLRADVETTGRALTDAARAGDATAALLALGTHRLLLAHREGPYGVTQWAATAETWVAAATGFASTGAWPLGRPLLVTENDRSIGLYNGDTGVVVADGDAVAVALRRPGGPPPGPPAPAARGPARARHDGPPRPGQPVRPGHPAPAPRRRPRCSRASCSTRP